jgi:SAM-dependent methyltransferase
VGPADLEYVLLRLARRFLFTAARLERLGRFLPYYRVNQGRCDPSPIRQAVQAALAALGADLAGRRVLEVGSGATNSLGYALLAAGAAEVVCFEPFIPLDARQDARLRPAPDAPGPDGVRRVTDLAAVPDAAIDLVVSNSVLEHVTAPDALFAGLGRVLAPGGRMVHRVDYRDHFFKYPYHFLKFSQSAWRRFLDPGDLPRWRLDDHLAALTRAGFAVTVLDATRNQPAFDRIAPGLHPDFQARDPALLAVATATLACWRGGEKEKMPPAAGGDHPPGPPERGERKE